MSKRLTLAEQLAQISQPAPADFDPEDAYSTYNHEKNQEQKDLAAGRVDYLDVGPSGLRKKGEAVVDAKYAGKKGSRKGMFEGSGSEEEDEDEEDEDAGMMDDFEDLEGKEGSAFGEEGAFDDEEDEDDDEEEEGDEEEEEEEEMPAPPPKKASSKSSGKSRAKEQDEKAMLSQLKQAASADVEKGRDVKKQLAFCDNLFESRIKLQKAVTSTNALPQASNSSTYFSALPAELAETLAEVESLNEELFVLRQELLRTNESVEMPKGFGEQRKRKRGGEGSEVEEYVKATVKDLAAMDVALNPFLRSTITKWSDKVLAASGLALGANKKFKAVNQNAMQQIDHALSPAERERLIKRTRVRRDSDKPIVGKVELAPLEGEKKKGDEEVFDDGDFYGQLLRDVVESRMLDLDDPTLASLRLASARGKKTKKVVDTRASKGRKIRYHVHEKVQNFMIPIDAGGWHEEQVDELFASLLGRTFPLSKEQLAVKEAEARRNGGGGGAGEVEVGSLRIFG